MTVVPKPNKTGKAKTKQTITCSGKQKEGKRKLREALDMEPQKETKQGKDRKQASKDKDPDDTHSPVPTTPSLNPVKIERQVTKVKTNIVSTKDIIL